MIKIGIDDVIVAPVGEQNLKEIIEKVGWPQGATCATQEIDGELLFWDCDIEIVKDARKEASPATSLVSLIGIKHQIHADYSDIDFPVRAPDWATCVVTRNS